MIITSNRIGVSLLSSVIADVNLVTDWVFFSDSLIVKKAEIYRWIFIFQLSVCVVGTCSWLSVATGGWFLEGLKKISYWPVMGILHIVWLAISFIMFLPVRLADYLYFTRTAKVLFFPVEFLTYLFERCGTSYTGRIRLSNASLLSLGILFEDIAQITITYLIGLKIGYSNHAVMNILLAAFDLLMKIAEIYDTRGVMISGADLEVLEKLARIERVRLRTIKGHSERVMAVTKSGPNQIVSASKDLTTVLWDTNSGKSIHSFSGSSDAVNFVCGLDKTRILTASENGTVKVFEIETGKCLQTLPHGDNVVDSVAVSPCGNFILTACGEEQMRRWDSTTYELLHTYPVKAQSVCFFDDVHFITASLYSDNADLWTVDFDFPTTIFKSHIGSVHAIAKLTVDTFLTGSDDKTIKLWSLKQEPPLKTFLGHEGFVWAVEKINDNMFVSTSADTTAKLWDVRDESCLFTYEGHIALVQDVTFLPELSAIATASETIQIWSIKDFLVAKSHKFSDEENILDDDSDKNDLLEDGNSELIEDILHGRIPVGRSLHARSMSAPLMPQRRLK